MSNNIQSETSLKPDSGNKKATFTDKFRTYGIREVLYRALIRIMPNNLNYFYFIWRKYIFGYAFFSIEGIKMYLDLKNDDGLSKELILYGKRERFTYDHFLSSGVLTEGQIALDVGGNIGYYALPEAKLVGKSGKVYAIEPVLGNYELLKRNIELNDFKNVSTYQLAMGESESEIDIYVRAKKNLSSLTPLPSDKKGGLLRIDKVKVTTVDAFSRNVIGQFPHLVRMDVEGYEASILEGMKETLRSGATLLIEFHPMFLTPEQKERIISLLRETGYTRAFITVNPKAELNPMLKYLNKKVGLNQKPAGLREEGDLDFMKKLLDESPRVFNAFLYH